MLLKHVEKKRVEINIIPMVDIVFQLIIFFLVAMQVKENKVTALNLPLSLQGGKVDDKEEPLIINVVDPDRAYGQPYRVMFYKFNLEELKTYLINEKNFRLKYKKGKEKEMPAVRIRADMNAEFKNIQEALVACRNAFIWKIRITTKRPN